jgi:Ca-activated chloride channel family protein
VVSLKRVLLSILLLFRICPFAWSQGSGNSSQVSRPALRVDVDLVTLTAAVTDEDDRAVEELDSTDFRIWEDKIEQQIAHFSADDAPVSVGIILDTSGSMQDKISAARDAATTFLNNANSEDEYFLVEFNSQARVIQGFSSSASDIEDHLASVWAHGMTAVYDAIYLGLDKLKGARNPRKALLLITDGDDNRSRYKVSEIREFLKESDVQIYAIGIVDGNSELSADSRERAAIEELTDLSGGRAFFPDSGRELEDICAKIALDLKNQYVIAYKSTNLTRDGKWRKIRIRLARHSGLHGPTVRSRSGYYAPID